MKNAGFSEVEGTETLMLPLYESFKVASALP